MIDRKELHRLVDKLPEEKLPYSAIYLMKKNWN